MCTLFLPSYPLTLSTPPSHWCQSTPLGRTYFAILFSDFVEEQRENIKRKTLHFSLFEIKVATRGVSLWYFMYVCIINPIGLTLLIFFILL
jgi:hypothetical protein